MKCNNHNWEFHAELLDGTIVRWCSSCGGLQTYDKPANPNLGLDQVALTKYAPTEIRLPDTVKDDDGLYSEGLIRECQPELRCYSPLSWRNRTLFEKPWTPDDDGKMVAVPTPEEPEFTPESSDALQELLILSGLSTNNACNGK